MSTPPIFYSASTEDILLHCSLIISRLQVVFSWPPFLQTILAKICIPAGIPVSHPTVACLRHFGSFPLLKLRWVHQNLHCSTHVRAFCERVKARFSVDFRFSWLSIGCSFSWLNRLHVSHTTRLFCEYTKQSNYFHKPTVTARLVTKVRPHATHRNGVRVLYA